MAEAMDLILFIDSDSSDNNKRLEPTFIPDYRDFAFTKSELNLLQNEVIINYLKKVSLLNRKNI